MIFDAIVLWLQSEVWIIEGKHDFTSEIVLITITIDYIGNHNFRLLLNKAANEVLGKMECRTSNEPWCTEEIEELLKPNLKILGSQQTYKYSKKCSKRNTQQINTEWKQIWELAEWRYKKISKTISRNKWRSCS